MKVSVSGDTMTVDLHGLHVPAAKQRLQTLLQNAAPGIRQLVVIHGHHGGSALRDMVRADLQSPRILHIAPAFSAGQTVIFLRS